MSSHVFTAQDNTDKLTIRAYKAEFGRPQTVVATFGFTLGVFIDDKNVGDANYGEVGSRMVALSLDEAKNMRDLLDVAIKEHERAQ